MTSTDTDNAISPDHLPNNRSTIESRDEKAPSLIDNDTVFNAEKLLKTRTWNGQVEYLVKWVGYPLSEAT